MSWRTEVVLRLVVLLLAGALLVTRLVQQDWIWAGLWAIGVTLVGLELRRLLREGPDRSGRRNASRP